MAQQTAVEWLYKLSKQRELDKFDLEQAKAMEKEQIMHAYKNGENRSAELYYNETYNK
jgi:HEPN domain-containing protein